MKRLFAAMLIFALVLGLAGCASKSADTPDVPAPSPVPTDAAPSRDTDTDPQLLPDNAVDAAAQILGFPNSTVLLTVDGAEVTAEEYLYWLGNMTAYYDQMYYYGGYGSALDLTEEVSDGVTWDQQLKEIAYQNAVLLAITPRLAEELGVSLSQEKLEELAQTHADGLEETGRDVYAYQLQAMNVNDRTAYAMDRQSALFTQLQSEWIEKASGELGEAEVRQFARDNDFLRAKHILLLTKDPVTGNVYDEDQVAAQRTKAEDILRQLKEGADFDLLMTAHSEDTGLATNPDGYLFTSGEMVAEFEQGTRDLEIGQFSQELIESTYGYHIILRLDPDCEDLRTELVEDKFNDMVQYRVDSANVVKAPEYDTFTTADYYQKLLEFQSTLVNPSEVDLTDQSKADLTPAP